MHHHMLWKPFSSFMCNWTEAKISIYLCMYFAKHKSMWLHPKTTRNRLYVKWCFSPSALKGKMKIHPTKMLNFLQTLSD